jgi:hypothetical protein
MKYKEYVWWSYDLLFKAHEIIIEDKEKNRRAPY